MRPIHHCRIPKPRATCPSPVATAWLLAAAAAAAASAPHGALAADPPSPSAPARVRVAPVPLEDSGASPGGGAPNAAREPNTPTPAAPGIPPNPYANFRWKGVNLNLPPPQNTVDLNLGGLRQKLANDYGIGYIGFSGTNFFSNVLNHAQKLNGQQTYVGQKPTIISQNFMVVTVDLSRYGIPDGQIAASGVYLGTSWNPSGPNTINLGTLSYYQTFLNKRVEFKAGLLANSFEFVGPFTAGSLNAGVFGVQGNILAQTGLSAQQFPTPGANVTVHVTPYVYDKFGVSRATSGNGLTNEHNYNPTGVSRFNTPNSGGLFINEFGYLRPAAADAPQMWLRGGALLSNARYNHFDPPPRRSGRNYALFALGDRQLIQTSNAPGDAYRGLYGGFTVEYSPSYLNLFSQYYEARLYGLGIIPGRPRDQTSLLFTETVFSKEAVNAFQARRALTHNDSKAITFSHSAQVTHGVYLSGAVSYIDNPSPVVYNSSTGSALDLIGGLSLFF